MAGYSNFKRVSFAGKKACYRLLSGLDESAEPCSACGTTVVLIYCMKVKGEIGSNFMFQFVTPSFTGEYIVRGGTGGISHKGFILVSSARDDRGITACSVVSLDKCVCQHSTL